MIGDNKSLPEDNASIVASQYQLYLPTERQLLDEVSKEILDFKGRQFSPESQ